ncbi:unnamed protein product [Ceratitis capitata]|uniref:(Mediterranean fruit fly) hypothetical protein n=1 Tax=Ceratitis capitata TaxID=7213 RepID=A0A811U1T5_CERCA|nr:unnamed protein product [Ceratitis capitata]
MVEKFCCFRLESVAKCLGWLGVIQFAILIIPLIISLAFVNEFVNYLARKGGYTLFNHSDIERVLTICLAMFIVLITINFATNLCLLLGTEQKRHNLLLPWLIVKGIFMVVPIISAFFGIFIGIIFVPLNIYIWICMYSLYKRIKTENKSFVE